MKDAAATAFLVAASVHAGFLAAITPLVYPALARVRAAHWRQAHDRHRRSIAPVVAVTYVAVAGAGAWWLVVDWSTLAAIAVGLRTRRWRGGPGSGSGIAGGRRPR